MLRPASTLVLLICWAMPASASDLSGTVTLKGKAAGPVVVFVDGEGPPIKDMTGGEVVQAGRQFNPHGLVVGVGASVKFSNRDNVFHHVFSLTPGSDFEVEAFGRGGERSVRFPEPGIVDVYCNIHASMSMKILVLPNAWYAHVNDDGSWTIPNVSPGTRRLVAWSAGHRVLDTEIDVPETDKGGIDLTLKPALPDLHFNMRGLPYEPYP